MYYIKLMCIFLPAMKPDFVRKMEDFEVKEQEVAILEVEISSETADVVWVKVRFYLFKFYI